MDADVKSTPGLGRRPTRQNPLSKGAVGETHIAKTAARDAGVLPGVLMIEAETESRSALGAVGEQGALATAETGASLTNIGSQ